MNSLCLHVDRVGRTACRPRALHYPVLPQVSVANVRGCDDSSASIHVDLVLCGRYDPWYSISCFKCCDIGMEVLRCSKIIQREVVRDDDVRTSISSSSASGG
jgi:hypothetical protein